MIKTIPTLIRFGRGTMPSCELAEKIGVGNSYMSQVETGKTIPSPELARKIATALQIDIPSFVRLVGREAAQEARNRTLKRYYDTSPSPTTPALN